MVVICAASVGLAVMQRALSLAVLASIGGYLAPVMLSTGSGDHVGLFSYYLLISVGILAISVWQSWRVLNLIGFAFTFGIATLWGANNYQPRILSLLSAIPDC
ncbi:Predicted membrane protein [Budvicia aquatica]|uniref:Predicted membrane protein n=1 Tax=Budvicia aquatica TaxID=82979 RepID=A0A484ZJ02_9GAMM|nr:Predicted membrane protein [Budvicia aquatica]